MTSKNNEIIEPENNQDSQPETSSTEAQESNVSEAMTADKPSEESVTEAASEEAVAESSDSEQEKAEPEEVVAESGDTEKEDAEQDKEAEAFQESEPEPFQESEPELKETFTPPPPPAPDFSPEIAAAKKQGSKSVKLATLAVVLSLFVGGGSAYLSNQQALQYKAQVDVLNVKLGHLTEKLDNLAGDSKAAASSQTSSLNNLRNKTETQFKQQEASLSSLQVAISEIKGRRPNEWLLAEADYLVKLAGRKLFLDKDVESATRLMESADQRIAALNDPSLVPLRKELTQDIVTLKAVPVIDREGLTIRLTTLQEQVDSLPLSSAILPNAPKKAEAVVSEDIQDWQENLVTSLKDFSEQFITFRSRDGNVIPLLSPEQHYYLKENIKGKIESAIRAIYTENDKVYQTSLNVASEWAGQFFNSGDADVAQFTQSLDELSKASVQVSYPVKLQSQKALQDVITERLRREVTSLTMQEEKQ